MSAVYKYYKNSNTGDLIRCQTFPQSEYSIKFPTYWYRGNEPIGENLKPVGYVEVSKKKYDRESKKANALMSKN